MSIELRKRRIIAGTLIIALAFLSLAGVLVKTQLIDGDKYKTLAKSLSESTITVKASRG
jgi:cell division protein FtsI/penicillin-binding protein 2